MLKQVLGIMKRFIKFQMKYMVTSLRSDTEHTHLLLPHLIWRQRLLEELIQEIKYQVFVPDTDFSVDGCV